MHPATVAASVLIFLAVLATASVGRPIIGRWLNRRQERYARQLNDLFLLDISPRSLVWASGGAAVVAALLAWGAVGSPWAAAAGAWVGTFLPGWVLRLLARRRRERLEGQLVDGILALSNSVRAGLTLVDAIRLVEENASAPISQSAARCASPAARTTSAAEPFRMCRSHPAM